MSKEVGCHFLDVFFVQLKREGRPAAPLGQGLPVPLEQLRRRGERMDWDDFVLFMRNASSLWTNEQLARMGEEVFAVPAMRAVALIARLLFDAEGFFRYVFDKAMGPGEQSFGAIDCRLEKLAPRRLRLELYLKPGYRHCPEFFHVSGGNFRGMSRVLGLGPSDVTMEWIPGGARYQVVLPEGGGLLRRFRQAVTAPFTAAAAGKALKASHYDLEQKYVELYQARDALAEQTDRLKVVNRLGAELASHQELVGLAGALRQVFEEELPEVGLSLWFARDPSSPEQELLRTGPCEGTPSNEFELRAGADRIGRLLSYLPPAAPRAHPQLVEDLVPWVSIALGNARSFAQLGELKDRLSDRVEERTRELNQTMLQLADSLDRQKEADRLKTEFYDNVSHELRTPLSLILVTVEALRRGMEHAPPQTRGHVDRLERSSSRLLRLIDQLLDLARIGAGKMVLRRQAVDLEELVLETLLHFKGLAERKSLGLRLETNGPLDRAWLDPEKLDDVLHNLISNALRFTNAGEVVVRLGQRQDSVCLEVADTGVGIEAADLHLIFDRFAQADSTGIRRLGGTGIGLALVKEVIGLHGGTIRVDSQLGKGSTFVVTFPRSAAPVSPDAAPPGPDLPSAVAPARPRRRVTGSIPRVTEPEAPTPDPRASQATVLVVEDDVELRAFIVSLLRESYQVLEAADGEQGLLLARTRSPTLVVTDLMMPRMSGLQLLEQLRADPRTSEMPVILLTARHELESRLEGWGKGANDYLGKPFYPRELLARIDAQLRLKDVSARVAQTERLATASLLTSGFAHEVRNPLNGLLNALGPLRESLATREDPQLIGSMLDIIEQSSRRIRHLAESLLLMVRQDGEHQPVELTQSLSRALEALRWKIVPEVVVAQRLGEPLVVVGDGPALTQVWINLLDNALRAVGPAGQVEVSLERQGELAVVTVTDDGVGIPAENLSRLFEPFYSTRATGEGTGLGLALSQRIMLRHHGRIEVVRRPGKGTTFKAQLPLCPTG